MAAVGILKSYEHMGVGLLECVSGCRCDPLKLDGHITDRFSQARLAPRAHEPATTLLLGAVMMIPKLMDRLQWKACIC